MLDNIQQEKQMSNMMLVLMMVCGGVAVAIQPSINGRLAQKVGSFESSLISFVVGSVCLMAMVQIFGRGNLRNVATASWWELTGGLLGAFFVTMTIVAVPRMGTMAVMAVIIAGQLITGALLDQFGVFGMRQIALSPLRGIGMVLLCAGAALILKK
jgi:transporter family-2 protein